MWVFTKQGFFSAAQDEYCAQDEVMVRARDKGDLERLGWALGVELKIIELRRADYAFRALITKDMWAEYLSSAAQNIDYPTVKDNIVPAKDQGRKQAYYEVWEALLSWQAAKRIKRVSSDGTDKRRPVAWTGRAA